MNELLAFLALAFTAAVAWEAVSGAHAEERRLMAADVERRGHRKLLYEPGTVVRYARKFFRFSCGIGVEASSRLEDLFAAAASIRQARHPDDAADLARWPGLSADPLGEDGALAFEAAMLSSVFEDRLAGAFGFAWLPEDRRDLRTLGDLDDRVAWILQGRPAPVPYLRYGEVAGIEGKRWGLWAAVMGACLFFLQWLFLAAPGWWLVPALVGWFAVLMAWGEHVFSETELLAKMPPSGLKVKPFALAGRLYREYWHHVWRGSRRSPREIDNGVLFDLARQLRHFLLNAQRVGYGADFHTWLLPNNRSVDEMLAEAGFQRKRLRPQWLRASCVGFVFLVLLQFPIVLTRAAWRAKRIAPLWRVFALPPLFMKEICIPFQRPWWHVRPKDNQNGSDHPE